MLMILFVIRINAIQIPCAVSTSPNRRCSAIGHRNKGFRGRTLCANCRYWWRAFWRRCMLTLRSHTRRRVARQFWRSVCYATVQPRRCTRFVRSGIWSSILTFQPALSLVCWHQHGRQGLNDHLPRSRNATVCGKTANASSTPADSLFTSPSSRLCSEDRKQALKD
jgi:hypothetical protein